MATLTSILGTDTVSSTRGVINTNFQNLNADTQYGYKSSTSSIFSSLLTADTTLSFQVGANEAWDFKAIIVPSVNSAVDGKYSFSGPTGTAIRWSHTFDAGLYASGSILGGFMGLGSVYNAGGVGQGSHDMYLGTVVSGATAGSVITLWAQVTHTPSSALSVLQGSHIIARRIN